MQTDGKLSKFLFHLKFSESENYLNEHELYEVMRSRNLYQLQFRVRSNFQKRMRNIAKTEKARNYGFVNNRKVFVKRMREHREQMDKLREITTVLKTKLKISHHDEADVAKLERRYVPLPGSEEMYTKFPDIIQKFDSPKNAKRGESEDDSTYLPDITTPSMTGTIYADITETSPKRRYSMPVKSSVSPTPGYIDRRYSPARSPKKLIAGTASPMAVLHSKLLAATSNFFDENEEIGLSSDTDDDDKEESRNSSRSDTRNRNAKSKNTTRSPNTADHEKDNPTVGVVVASSASESDSDEQDNEVDLSKKLSRESTSLPYVQTPSMIATPIDVLNHSADYNCQYGRFANKGKESETRFLKTTYSSQKCRPIRKKNSQLDETETVAEFIVQNEQKEEDVHSNFAKRWLQEEETNKEQTLVDESDADDVMNLDSLKIQLSTPNGNSSSKCVEWAERYGVIQGKEESAEKFQRLFIDRPSKFAYSHMHPQQPDDANKPKKSNQGSKIRRLDKLSERLKLKTSSSLSLPELHTIPKAMVTMDPGGTTPDGRLVLTNADYQEYLAKYRKARHVRLTRARNKCRTLHKLVENFMQNNDDTENTQSYETIQTV